MYFALPGILSQDTAAVVSGFIGLAIPAFLPEAAQTEIYSTFVGSNLGLIGTGGQEVKTTVAISSLSRIEVTEKELTFTFGLVDLPSTEKVNGEVLSLNSARGVGRFEATAKEVRSTEVSWELVGFEPRYREIYGGVLITKQLSTIEPTYLEVQPLPQAIDLAGVIGSQFLPQSPGYVTGVIAPALELVGVEVGYPPEPLPVGFVGFAREILSSKTALLEVHRTWSTRDLSLLEPLENSPQSTYPSWELGLIEGVADLPDSKPLVAIELVTIEPVGGQARDFAPAKELIKIELAQGKTNSTLPAGEQIGYRVGAVWLNEKPFYVSQILLVEQCQGELQPVPPTTEIALMPYAAESLIIKP